MSSMTISRRTNAVKGMITVPGDKSISHRSIMLAALSNGTSTINNFLTGEDCLTTISAFQAMGIHIIQNDSEITVHGKGLYGLEESSQPINLGNSGTTTRLLLGILAGTPHHYCLYGDESLSVRPMDRVTIPLSKMGATFDGNQQGRLLPMSVRGGEVQPIEYTLPINSAQIKSSILLAGLFTTGVTKVVEPVPTRDHTERMLTAFGVDIGREGNTISLRGQQQLEATDIEVPGDISSAAFFICAAALKADSDLVVKDVGLNPTRTGIIDVLKRMGATIETRITRYIGDEPIGDVTVQGGPLNGITISGADIPRVIDEIPIIALLASQAEGKTLIKDAEDLRYKETDRIQAVVDILHSMGVDIIGTEDGLIINGKPSTLKGGEYHSYKDHRIGMMIAIASLLTDEEITLQEPDCISISYPSFFAHFDQILED
ncbi:3-phosphoshikimate 1-carboxyvinyltransferase [Pontibacillus yanchengensis Y32]|uniref:3-phosphoshikimate 1-carboxyvinyltransferase n=2 Tax=Pontibacillus yanchengensis TaxID=462910 RepID=A0A0A2TF09_9BACI|nr:3-phosphoshikimate 1-carboxyvinyltransferase [Pontibacillus yanchengensis]KGP73018.1 3-phosphoshikimate 1-carboxyvinyltransferase [Pontibacillus yanchengensis Y32]